MLDARIASGLNKIIPNAHFKKKVSLEEQEAQKDDRFPQGRQIAFVIYDYFRVTGAHDTVLDYADLFPVTLCNDTVQEFDTRWDEMLLSMTKIPSDDILESLYKFRICVSAQLKTVLELYVMEIHKQISMSSYQKLKTMVKRSIDQKLRLRNVDARHEKIEIRRSGQESQGIKWRWKRKKVFVTSGEKKRRCPKRDQCSFRHESNDRTKPTPKTAPPSQPPTPKTRGRSASRKRNVRGRSQSAKFNR